jgi:hypothetical protein
MDRWSWYGIQLGFGVALIVLSRKTKSRFQLILGILLVVVTLATMALRSS